MKYEFRCILVLFNIICNRFFALWLYRNSFGLSSPPISPELKEKILNEQVGSFVDEDHIETTFGVDGEIETNKSSKKNIWSVRVSQIFVKGIVLETQSIILK